MASAMLKPDGDGMILAVLGNVNQAKLFVEHFVSVSNDALHVVVGFVLFVAAAALLRRPITDWSPWLAVFGLLMINEIIDLTVEQWPDWGSQYGEGLKDLVLTMALPTLMLLAARFHPPLVVAPQPGAFSDLSEDREIPF